MSKQKQAILEKSLHTVEFTGLSKDDQKAINAYNQAIQKGLALFEGNVLEPASKIPGNDIKNIMEEFIADEQKALIIKFKDAFKVLLQKKVRLDNVIKQQRIEFNKAVVAEKKAFTKEANEALAIVSDIEKLRADYMASLTVDAATEELPNDDN